MSGVILNHRGSIMHVYHSHAHEPDTFIIETRENVDAITAKVEKLREYRAMAEGRLKDMRHVAEIPMSVVERALREGWFNDTAAWKRWMNDPDNKHCRVSGGRV